MTSASLARRDATDGQVALIRRRLATRARVTIAALMLCATAATQIAPGIARAEPENFEGTIFDERPAPRPSPSTRPATPGGTRPAAPPGLPPPATRPVGQAPGGPDGSHRIGSIRYVPGLAGNAYVGPSFNRLSEGRWVNSPDIIVRSQEPAAPAGGRAEEPRAKVANFSLWLEGKIALPVSGAYRFGIAGDADLVVRIDGREVFSRRRGGATVSGPVELVAGSRSFKIEWSDILVKPPSSHIQLLWGLPPRNDVLTSIPPAQFTRPVLDPPPTPGGVAPPQTAGKPATRPSTRPAVAGGGAEAGSRVRQGLWRRTYDGPVFNRLTSAQEAKIPYVFADLDKPGVRPNDPSRTYLIGFSLKLEGMIDIPETTEYRFGIDGEADFVMRIDDREVFSRRRDGPMSSEPVKLAAGRRPVTIEWSRMMGTPPRLLIQLLWARPGEELAVIPKTLFWYVPPESNGDEPVPPTTRPAAVATAPPIPTPPPPKFKPSSTPPGANVPDAAAATPHAMDPFADPAARRPPPKNRPPAPPDAALAEARKTVRTRYAPYYADRKPIVQQALVQKLIEAAAARATPPDEAYAMLREASEVAAAQGDVPASLAAIRAIVERWNVAEWDMTLAAMQSASKVAKTPAAAAALISAALDGATAALAERDYDRAVKLSTIAEAAGKDAADASLASRAKMRAAQIRDVQKEYARLAPVFAKLAQDPGDVDAATRAGKFYCLLIDDWPRGLDLLSKASEVELKVLAEMEKSPPPDAATQLKLADGWWNRAKLEREPYAARCKARAAVWYGPILKAGAAGGAGAVDDATRERIDERLVASSPSIDLMAGLELKRDAVYGVWSWSGRDLYTEGRGLCLIQLPCQPKGDYDFTIEFTCTAGDITVRQEMPGVGEGPVMLAGPNTPQSSSICLALDMRGIGFNDLSDGTATLIGTRPMQKLRIGVSPKQRHTSTVRVRQNMLRTYYDSQLTSEWAKGPDTARSHPQFQPPDPKCLAVGCMNTTMVIHSIRVTELPSK